MKTEQVIIIVLVAAIASYYVHDFLDNYRQSHPELR